MFDHLSPESASGSMPAVKVDWNRPVIYRPSDKFIYSFYLSGTHCRVMLAKLFPLV